MTSESKDDRGMGVTDETVQEIADLLFGGSVDLVSKSGAGIDPNKPPSKAGYNAAMAGNTVAAVGGTHALMMSAGHLKNVNSTPEEQAAKKAKTAARLQKIPGATKLNVHRAKLAEKIAANPGAAKKVALASGVGWLGLHGVELGADLNARHAIKQNYKHAQAKIAKMDPGSSDVHIPTASRLRRTAAKKASLKLLNSTPTLSQYPVKIAHRANDKVKKDAGFTFEGEFSKVDADKRQVFGWASIVELNGEPVVDLQGDYIDINEIEKSAYDYVIKSRKGGEMHRRSEDGQPVHASDMIESFIVTPEKIEKMGLPKSTPIGWWVGYQVNDDAAWDLVKSGKRTGFSIHGRGMRTPSEV